ncbi:PH domain-containing protein [Rhodoferax sp.]|uniref:PH domain-containing protein n=1 Tax=Rhodoferax sp. TaxID=50421 RepID=UPI002755E7D2|nr:PH domain-containing protein [Rhodoferax sp.]
MAAPSESEHPGNALATPANGALIQPKLPKLRQLWRLSALAQGTLLGVGLMLAAYLAAPSAWRASWLLLALLAWGGLLIAAWRYADQRFAAYEAALFGGEGLRVRRGVWWRKEVWLPIARLQHLDVSQGPLDRRWGMASLVLHTAGRHDHSLTLPGLPLDAAQALRATLMPRRQGAHD